ncbi:hypothetical protein [Micromonospora sp. WMMD998]|uniref:hypothetical protein n=1 Tax=Micromonospora sp. WMMD998 TaxID=3016092 RepID=UPI00249B7C8C|nr:hypothetical protein [Micromonospora sp. WMMD998]WFE39946.1 hypothetical protein O7619_16505 [Micromonospora sp. WMMD998]
MLGGGFGGKHAPVHPRMVHGPADHESDEPDSSTQEDPVFAVRLALYASAAGLIAAVAGRSLGSALFAENDLARGATIIVVMAAVGGAAGVLAETVLSSISNGQRRRGH